jgi:thiamine-monophosphate kinase
MREFEIIRRLQNKLTEGLSEEPGSTLDDGFLIPTTLLGRNLVGSVDTFVEGRHFLRTVSSPEQIGHKAFCAAFSDLAAMGASPGYALINLQCPVTESVEYLERIYVGINQFCQEFCVKVLGGNLSGASELSISVTALGGIAGDPKLRSAALAGEDLWISGELGLSHLGLLYLSQGRELQGELRERAISRYQRPIPRFLPAEVLAHISACIDISDGIFQDAGHIACRSKVALTLDLEELLPKGVPRTLGIEAILGGGDYELLFTAGTDSRQFLADSGLLRVGTVEPGSGVRVLDRELKAPEELAAEVGVIGLGCDHFQ